MAQNIYRDVREQQQDRSSCCLTLSTAMTMLASPACTATELTVVVEGFCSSAMVLHSGIASIQAAPSGSPARCRKHQGALDSFRERAQLTLISLPKGKNRRLKIDSSIEFIILERDLTHP